MYILPYIRKNPCSIEIPLTQFWLFLAKGGKSVWKTDEANPTPDYIVREYLEPNGLFGTACVKGDCLYYAIDTKRTNRNSFYTWFDEIDDDVECWRPFFWLGDDTKSWGWAEIARETSLGPYGSLERVWKDLN